MTPKRAFIRLTAITLTLALAGCGGGGSSSSTTTPAGGGVLVGAGSTFAFPLISKWSADYSKQHGVTITYGPIGSGGGIQAITNRTVDFGASDAPLSPDQQKACNGCLQIPWALAGTSIPYNLPGSPKDLKLTGRVLADIYLGKITKWNDPAITRLNAGIALPSLTITPIFRSDGSGTSYNFTDYLSRVSPEFTSMVGGATTQPSFPIGIGAKGSSGVAGSLSHTKGGITYIDLAYSITSHFAYAAIQNRAGRFTLPTIEAVAAAARAAGKTPPDNAISIVDPPASARNAYPISTFTYAIVPQRSAEAALLKAFLTYAITDGQQFAPDLQFAPLPPKVLAADKATITKIGS